MAEDKTLYLIQGSYICLKFDDKASSQKKIVATGMEACIIVTMITDTGVAFFHVDVLTKPEGLYKAYCAAWEELTPQENKCHFKVHVCNKVMTPSGFTKEQAIKSFRLSNNQNFKVYGEASTKFRSARKEVTYDRESTTHKERTFEFILLHRKKTYQTVSSKDLEEKYNKLEQLAGEKSLEDKLDCELLTRSHFVSAIRYYWYDGNPPLFNCKTMEVDLNQATLAKIKSFAFYTRWSGSLKTVFPIEDIFHSEQKQFIVRLYDAAVAIGLETINMALQECEGVTISPVECYRCAELICLSLLSSSYGYCLLRPTPSQQRDIGKIQNELKQVLKTHLGKKETVEYVWDTLNIYNFFRAGCCASHKFTAQDSQVFQVSLLHL